MDKATVPAQLRHIATLLKAGAFFGSIDQAIEAILSDLNDARRTADSRRVDLIKAAQATLCHLHPEGKAGIIAAAMTKAGSINREFPESNPITWRELAEVNAPTSKADAAQRLIAVAEALEASPDRPEAKNPPEIINEVADALALNQDAIYRVLTEEFKGAATIATESHVDEGEVRRQLPNLKRMGLVEHKHGVGYRRLS